jgi:deoxyadenosine/deoxycytidine kinase
MNVGHLIYRFYFLNSCFRQVMQIAKVEKIIQDRTIYEDAHIFLLLIFTSMGLMTNRDFQTTLL